MELYQLRTFVAVAEEEHLTRAAERLNAGQPALSAHVKALEEELGVSLFQRGPRGMRLTNAGRILKEKAEKTLRAAEGVALAAGELREEVSGLARIGLNCEPETLRAYVLVEAMRKRHPRVELSLNLSNSPTVLDAVCAGDLEGGFIYDSIRPKGGSVAARKLDRVEMCIIGPISAKKRLAAADWAELAAMPWVWFPVRCPCQNHVLQEFEKRGLAVNKVMASDHDGTIKSLVQAGWGLSILRLDDAREAEACGEISIRPDTVFIHDLSFIYRRDRENDRVIRALLAALEEIWAD